MSDPPKPLHDNVSRTKSSSPLGRAVFIGLRAADVWWQYSLFSQGWASQLITKLGGSPVVAGNVWATPSSSLHIYYHLVSFLSLGSSIKQIAAMMFVSEQETPVGSAALIAFFNREFADLMARINVKGDFNDEIDAGLKAGIEKFKATQSW